MTTLPDKNGNIIVPSSDQPEEISGGISGKEKEGMTLGNSELPMQDMGKEMELPKEVRAAGVHQQSTVISIPKPIQEMGVHPVGSELMPTAEKTTTPLTDAQIADGLHQGITNSIRWLAEWCKRQLKQLGVTKTKHI